MSKLFKRYNPKFALVLCLLLVACGGSTEAPKPTDAPAPAAAAPTVQAPAVQAPTVQATEAPAATPTEAAVVNPAGDPKEALLAAMRKQLKAGPYRSVTTIVSDGSTTVMTGEVIPPDRLHVKTEGMEMVYVGSQSWIKAGDKWEASTMPSGSLLAQFSDAFVEEMAGTMSDVKLVGPDTLDGAPMMVYTYNSDMNKATTMKIDSKSSVKVWISVAEGLIRKQEIDGEAMGIKSMTTQTVEFDAGIQVEPPVK